MTALSDLRARVLAGSGYDRSLEWDIWAALQGVALNDTGEYRGKLANPEWVIADWHGTSDLNAVIALVKKRLPGWKWGIRYLEDGGYSAEVWLPNSPYGSEASSPARALLAALLEAMETNDGE